MREYRASVEIAESPAVVFAYLTDPELLPKWVPLLVTTEIAEGTGFTEGSVFRSTYRLQFRAFEGESRILEVEQPHLLVSEERMLRSTSIHRIQLTQSEDRPRTKVDIVITPISMPRWRKLLQSSSRFMDQQAMITLERLKVAVERPGKGLDPGEKQEARKRILGAAWKDLPYWLIYWLIGALMLGVLLRLFVLD